MPDLSSTLEQWELFPKELSSYRDGRDELNLAEFPITTVGSRFDPSVKTLSFEDDAFDRDSGETVHRKLTVTASDKYGLPTAADDEVLLGLLQLSRWQRFSSPTVKFTPYQLMKILGWRISTANYKRLRESIERWLGVTLHYQNAWRDKKTGHWVDAGFHFIDFVEFHRPGKHGSSLAPDGLSVVRWNDIVFVNMREGNLKTLDFHFYSQLKSSIAKRMFRFLDKRFYHRKKIHFALEKFSCEKIGLSRPVKLSATGKPTIDVAQLKRRLLAAIRELEAQRFIVALPAERRFYKDPTGEWQVVFERQTAGGAGESVEVQPALAIDVAEVSPLEGRLTGHGVSLSQARRLASEHPPERIEAQLEALEYLLTREEKLWPQNRAGWLVQAVTENYGPPRGFKTRQQRDEEAREKARKAEQRERAKRQGKQTDAQRLAEAQAEVERVSHYLAALSAEQRQELEAAALRASPLGRGRMSAKVRQSLVFTHVLSLLPAAGCSSP